MLLWANNIDILAVVDGLTNEWHILQRKECQFSLHDSFGSTEHVLGLPVESSLTEDGTNEATFVKVL